MRPWPDCTARVGAIRSGWTSPAIAMPKPGDDDAAKGLGDISRMAADIVIDRLGAQISAEDQETLVAAMSLVTPWLMAEPKRYALMHGDYRLDNMLFDPDRTRITVVDWQTVGIGLPGRDLAYFTGTSLTPVRAEIERRPGRARTTERYWVTASPIMTSTPAGATTGSAWCRCRCSSPSAPRSPSTTERGDDMMLAMLSRGCRAIRELDTLELITSYQAT